MRFKLLRGRHAQREKQADGTFLVKTYEPVPGKNIIESETDLVAKFNKVGSVKFEALGVQSQRISEDVKQKVLSELSVEELAELLRQKGVEVNNSSFDESSLEEDDTLQSESSADEYHGKELEQMTKFELQNYANDYDIDISGLSRKSDILEKIKLELYNKQEESDTDSEETESEESEE